MATKAISLANIDSARFSVEASDPSTPAAGFRSVYTKAGGVYVIDESAVVTGPFFPQAPGTAAQGTMLPTADVVPFTIRGHASATANLIEIKEGTGPTTVMSVSGSGSTVIQPFTDSAQAWQIADKGDNFNTFTISTMGKGVACDIYATYVGSGNTGTSYGLGVLVDNDSADDITNVHGVHIYQSVQNGAGVITNAYGLYIDDVDAGATLNYSIFTEAGNVAFNTSNGVGNTTINGTSVSVNYDLGLVGDGVLMLKETTTPTADTNYGKLYTKNDNGLYFQDGAGTEHLIHSAAYSNIWFHSAATAVTISTINTYTAIDTFANVGVEDEAANAVGSAATDNITIAATAGGRYNISFHASIANAGAASKEMVLVPGITLATPKDITNVTDDTVSPIVITSVAHGFENGDCVQIANVLVNTAANGSFRIANKTNDTFEIVALDEGATTGNGDYDEGTPTGDVTIWYPGALNTHREVGNATFGVTAASAIVNLSGGDAVGLYVANIDDTNDLSVHAVGLSVDRKDIN